MEWREQSSVSCEDAYLEAQRWIEAVTKKKFGSKDFRSALENGILLCDLINNIKPGIIKRVNRLPTPIAGLDNLNVFLKACGKLGLKEAQLFHPGDLQDLSTRVTVKHQETNRRLKNVLITIYWLGRRAQCDHFYDGPYLNFKAFEGLLGTALYKALHETSSHKLSNIRDSGFGDSWCSVREELHHLRGGGGDGHKRDDSLDSLDSLGLQPHSISSDTTLKGSSEGCFSDTEADSGFRMTDNKDNVTYRRSVSITPKSTAPFNQFLPSKDKPSGYVPAPLRRKRAERNEDSRRSLANYTYTEDEGTLTRSKSTSDIQVNPNIIWQARSEQLQKYREQLKESEDKWQDDLSKWKTRRRSVNSDIVQKKEEREKIEQITHSSNRRSKTFKEMQEERENKGHLSSLSYLEEDVFERPAISLRSQTLPTRSYSIDSHYYSSETFAPSLKEAKPPTGSPATARLAPRAVDTVDSPAGSGQTSTTAVTPSSHSSLHSSSQSPAEASSSPSSLVSGHISSAKPEVISTSVSSSSSVKKVFDPLQPSLRTKVEVEVSSSGSLYKHQPQLSSMEPNSSSISRISSSLPRSYQKSDSARLSSVLTPKPFGTKPSLVTSLPRAFMVDNSQRVNGDVAVPKKSAVPSRYQQFMTLEDEADSSSAHSSEEEEEEEMNETTVKSTSVSSVPPPVKSEAAVTPAPIKESVKANYCEMRISLNQKPNSSKDFGFQAVWDSTGAHVTSIQPGSHAEMYQLQAGDEVLTVNRHQVAEMNYIDWKTCMQEALQEGSLVMDIRRHGKNSSSDAATVNSSLDLTSRISMETLTAKGSPKHPVIDVASNGVNGVVREELLNMGNKGGSESAMPDIPVPLITPSVSRWSWDPEEERRRQEKWQKEQELLLQEKYKRDQEKLQAEWLKAQQDIRKSTDQGEPERLEVDSHNIGPRSPLSPLKPPASFPWEAKQEHQRQVEENRRREEERELQRLHEEKERKERQEEEERKRKERQVEEERKRKERQVEEERMWKERQEEEDRKRKEQEDRQQKEEEERKKLEEEELRWQKRREEEREEARRRQDAAEQLRRERERAFEQQQRQQQWMKSKSTPQLEQENNAPWKVNSSGASEKRGQQPVSQAEVNRQHILNEMKKKTPLLTDNSWIRQRSSSAVNSMREDNLPNMRRGESLDNLDARSSWRSSWTPRSNAYIPNYTRPQSAFYGSTSFYGGGSGVHRPSTLPSSYAPDSLRSGAGTPSSLLSPQSHSPSSLSPTCSPEPTSNAGTSQQRNSAPTVSLTSEDQRPGLKSEYEINSCTVTSATCDSKLASQPPCDMSVLQQIDEETTCDNNP